MTLFCTMRRAMCAVATLTVCLGAVSSTVAQSPISDPGIDNLRHPPNTSTAPLGTLGRVDRQGTGPVPMILLPGAAFGGSVWKDFMARNATAYTMYAITPAGYENTMPPPWPEKNDFSDAIWTNALCDAVVKLIDQEKLKRPVIVGHHLMGDHYALRIALEHPEKVRAAVIVAGMPSMAIAAVGENRPGTPAKTASLERRRQVVHGFFVPFYKSLTQRMWNAGTFQPRAFCRDAARASKLYEQQVSVPLPTQLRYFFEYECSDLEPALAKLQTPLLVVLPKRQWSLDAVLDMFKESNEIMYGDRERARTAWTRNLISQWGDVDEGIRWQWDQRFRWERLQGVIPNVTIRFVEDAGIFVMEDQPRALDQELRSFIESLQ